MQEQDQAKKLSREMDQVQGAAQGLAHIEQLTDITAQSTTTGVSPQSWTIALTANPSPVTAGNQITLTAIANQSLSGNSADWLYIFDQTTDTDLAACNTGTVCQVTQTYSGGTPDSYIAYIGAQQWGLAHIEQLTDTQAHSATATPASGSWTLDLAANPNPVAPGDPITLTATANQDLANTNQTDWLYIFDQTTDTDLIACDTGTTCQTTSTFTGGTPHNYIAYIAAAHWGLSQIEQLTGTQSVSDVATTTAATDYLTPGSTFNPTVELHINTWNYKHDDASGATGDIDYNLTATATGIGDGGPCATVEGCSFVFQGGMPDTNNVIHPTSTIPATGSTGIQGPPDPATITAVGHDAAVADQIYLRAAIYAGTTLVADTTWYTASSFSVQGADAVDAGSALAVLTLAAPELQDPCAETFPRGSDFNGSTLNDELELCEAGRLAGDSLPRAFAGVVGRYGVPVIKFVAVAVAANSALTYSDPQPTYDAHEDPAYLERIRTFMNRKLAMSAEYQTTDERVAVETVLDKCDALAAAVGFPQSDCDSMPIFAPGIDVAQAAAHDYSAITVNRNPAFLNYTNPPPVYSGWYRSWNVPGNPCYGTDPTQPPYDTTTQNCDEYPFRSTRQAGPGASLRVIDRGPNQLEGRLLIPFYTKCPTVAAGAPFLVVPTVIDPGATIGIPTRSYCAP